MNTLKSYNKKRNFNKTNEPYGKKKTKKNIRLKFVVQHHIARKDHYDVRLEWNGVYKSFAVPKGPSYSTLDKRLAIQVEDHPISYGNFEGTIPEGEYGAGTVMLWDKGYWSPLKDYKPNFDKGPIKFTLKGSRLIGSWSLVKFKDKNWLLIKERDEYVKKYNINSDNTSVKTGRTMNEIKKNITKIKDIKITHPNKVIFKNNNITKKDIIEYYKLVGNRMMNFLDNRLISTVRCPNGYNGEKFFMKHLNSDSKSIGKKIVRNKTNEQNDYYYIKDINGILYEVQMNSYEFHIWGSKQNSINKPDFIVFDLDPDTKLSLKKIRDGVKDLKSILDDLKLKSYLKTSGGKGYHIFVPLPCKSWKNAEDIASKISAIMVEKWPNKYTTNMRKEKRTGKIFIDYFRNKLGATSVCPYSIRLKEKASISCPIKWSELDNIKPDQITIKNINDRLKHQDPWKNFFKN